MILIFYTKNNFPSLSVYLGLYFILLLLKWASELLQFSPNGHIRMKRVLQCQKKKNVSRCKMEKKQVINGALPWQMDFLQTHSSVRI